MKLTRGFRNSAQALTIISPPLKGRTVGGPRADEEEEEHRDEGENNYNDLPTTSHSLSFPSRISTSVLTTVSPASLPGDIDDS